MADGMLATLGRVLGVGGGNGMSVRGDQTARPEESTDQNALLTLEPALAAAAIRRRWDAKEEDARREVARQKVNLLRWQGNPWAQVHYSRPTEVWLPPTTGSRNPPVINELQRAVDGYIAQICADDPYPEAYPGQTTDESRDAAEASSQALRGEWHRTKLVAHLNQIALYSAVFKSSYLWLFPDSTHHGTEAAQLYLPGPDGKKALTYVNEQKQPTNPVLDEFGMPALDELGQALTEPVTEQTAHQIPRVEIDFKLLTPANVRWSDDAEYVWLASEVSIGLLITLRELFELHPELRDKPLAELAGETPAAAEDYLLDLTGASRKSEALEVDDDLAGKTGDDLDAGDGTLDKRIFYLIHYRRRSALYPDGFYGCVAGKLLCKRGPQPDGIPLVQFKCLPSIGDKLGRALVDILKDPQELLTLLHTNIIRFVQMYKRRWMVPIKSVVNKADLNSPTASYIEYNPAAGELKQEEPPQFPDALTMYEGQVRAIFGDMLGLHASSRGIHEPGVTSGQHVREIVAGDQTLLGLTRRQYVAALEYLGEVWLKMIQREWTTARMIRYQGRDRVYITKAFQGTDFAGVDQVRIAQSSFLMLNPRQKMDQLQSYATLVIGQQPVLSVPEFRRLAPFADTAGIELSEDVHYQRARRQNEVFLEGPPQEVLQAYEQFAALSQDLTATAQGVGDGAAVLAGDPGMAAQVTGGLEQRAMQIQMEWEAVLLKFAPIHEPWEDAPMIAAMHAEEHLRMLATEKAEQLPGWWRAPWVQHAYQEAVLSGMIVPMMPTEPVAEDGAGENPPDDNGAAEAA